MAGHSCRRPPSIEPREVELAHGTFDMLEALDGLHILIIIAFNSTYAQRNAYAFSFFPPSLL